MILTVLATAALAAALVPLIQRDLKRAVVRQQWRARGWHQVRFRFEVDIKPFIRSLDQAAKALARLTKDIEKRNGGAR